MAFLSGVTGIPLPLNRMGPGRRRRLSGRTTGLVGDLARRGTRPRHVMRFMPYNATVRPGSSHVASSLG
ncbi:MAG: hypothetical protein MK003_12420 [Pseudomonadales bacterium]|nr:hypothetical protein [Pseudomonadales bacterium]